MSLGEPKARDDHHGQWLCFFVNDKPALQAFFPTDLDTRQEISVFWRGWTSLQTISRYVHHIVDRDNYTVQAQTFGPSGVGLFYFGDRHRSEVQLPDRVFEEIAPRDTAFISATVEDRRATKIETRDICGPFLLNGRRIRS